MNLSPDDVKGIADGLLSRSKANHCIVSISGGDATNVRFAANNATSNGSVSSLNVSIESIFGQKAGTATVTSLDRDTLEKAQALSEQIAQLAPPNPELLPPPGPQSYEKTGAAFDERTANVRADDLAVAASQVTTQGVARGIDTTGYIVSENSFSALANSAGLFVYDKRTEADFTVTARNRARLWSGWACTAQTRFDAMNADETGARAIGKAAHAEAPVDVDPGQYSVILEPSAVADLVAFLLWSLDARPADEGRSFLTKKGGGTKRGEKLLDERVSIISDPADAMAPEAIYGSEGLANRKTSWVSGGVIDKLAVSRFWAQKTGTEPLSAPRNFSMQGGTTPVADMIAATRRGILVTRLWYIRVVDPQTLLLTGMTRDGNFLIENGKITGPALNMRFNESPLAVLSNIDAVGPAERTLGSEFEEGAISVPPLLVRNFTFSSRSSGI